jgi:hypothetical protein
MRPGHSAASRYHTSPTAIGRTPPDGFARGRRRASRGGGDGGGLPPAKGGAQTRICLSAERHCDEICMLEGTATIRVGFVHIGQPVGPRGA